MPTLAFKRITSLWIIVVLVLFLSAISMGILMRFAQGSVSPMDPAKFYVLMTTHGVTMIGAWAAASILACNYLMARYVKVSTGLNLFALIGTGVGVALLWTSTFSGNFHAGWTFLYPLPFKAGGGWQAAAANQFLWGLMLLSIVWLIWCLGMVWQILQKYSLPQAFAWQHLSKKEPAVETPPLILITMVSLVGMIVCFITAIILLAMFFSESGWGLSGKPVLEAKLDPLLMKNLTFFFGHTVANEALYLGLAVVYELLPELGGRPKLHTSWYVSLGWNCAVLFILTAFFHHLYMDFVQPQGFQIVGQVASYLASVPSVVVTLISLAAVLYGRGFRWSLPSLMFLVGAAGWIIGGIGALIDATISNNIILHNTLWVPAHFHTYNLMGNVLFALGFFCWVADDFRGTVDPRKHGLKLVLMIIGGFGFVLMFYLGGAYSVPRRFAFYPAELTHAQLFATMGAWFALVYSLGLLLVVLNVLKKCFLVFLPQRS